MPLSHGGTNNGCGHPAAADGHQEANSLCPSAFNSASLDELADWASAEPPSSRSAVSRPVVTDAQERSQQTSWRFIPPHAAAASAEAAVWENEAGQKKFFNVTFARTYMDEARNFHDTDSYGRDDLPVVAKLADQAHTFIFERLAELKSEQSE